MTRGAAGDHTSGVGRDPGAARREPRASTSMQTGADAPVDTVLAGRDLRLDLFRGLSLWFLFLEQMPPANMSLLTLRADKFSVAIAIFVLVFGYTAGLVYGQTMRERGLYLTAA